MFEETNEKQNRKIQIAHCTHYTLAHFTTHHTHTHTHTHKHT